MAALVLFLKPNSTEASKDSRKTASFIPFLGCVPGSHLLPDRLDRLSGGSAERWEVEAPPLEQGRPRVGCGVLGRFRQIAWPSFGLSFASVTWGWK